MLCTVNSSAVGKLLNSWYERSVTVEQVQQETLWTDVDLRSAHTSCAKGTWMCFYDALSLPRLPNTRRPATIIFGNLVSVTW